MKNHYNSLKDNKKPHNPNYGVKHFIELPMTASIVGFTGSGKTNTLMNIIDAFKGSFQKIIFCTMSFECDPLYVNLRERLEKLAEKHGLEPDAYIQVFDNGEVPDVDEIEEDIPTLIVFDDLQGEKKANDQVAKFYKYGRKKGFSSIYLAQSYIDIPIFIRKQLKYLFIKKVNQIDDLKRILSKYGLAAYRGRPTTSRGCASNRLEEIYNHCTADFTHCMLLDLLRGYIYRDFTELIE